MTQPRLTIVPMTRRAGCAFLAEHHRHHAAPPGYKFALGVVDETGQLRGIAMVGRPIARAWDDGLTAEVLRTCTDGCSNANSCLYGAAWRAARAMGYRRLITYTQEGESGASLRGAGYRVVATRKARPSWAQESVALRHIRDPIGNGGVQRTLWEATP